MRFDRVMWKSFYSLSFGLLLTIKKARSTLSKSPNSVTGSLTWKPNFVKWYLVKIIDKINLTVSFISNVFRTCLVGWKNLKKLELYKCFRLTSRTRSAFDFDKVENKIVSWSDLVTIIGEINLMVSFISNVFLTCLVRWKNLRKLDLYKCSRLTSRTRSAFDLDKV